MSKDRKVSTDALETLGTIIDEYQKRDAIHLAVEPVIAGETLYPNDDIRILKGQAYRGSRKLGETIGKVDPFLEGIVLPNQRFWLVVYPREITSLRHVWSHPEFADEILPVAYHEEELTVGSRSVALPEPENKFTVSEKWIRDFCDRIPLRYDMLMNAAAEYVESKRRGGYGEYLVLGGLLEGEYVPDEFWDHYENVTGEQVPDSQRGSFFSCSC